MFGQGMIRCHPYAYAQIEALEEGDVKAFDTLLFSHIGHVTRNKARAFVLGVTRGYAHITHSQGKAKRYEQKLAWASARFAYLSDVALGLMGASLKRRESVSGRFGDVLAQMYFITAALKRYEIEGSKESDTLFLEVAVEDAFGKIDSAFRGILENLAPGALGIPFRMLGYYTRVNPMGKTIKDESLHHVAAALCEDDSVRERICGNIYMGERSQQLLAATHKMQEVKALLDKEKKKERLTEGEKRQLKEARELQHEIITVDSFTHDDYFSRNTIDKKV